MELNKEPEGMLLQKLKLVNTRDPNYSFSIC